MLMVFIVPFIVNLVSCLLNLYFYSNGGPNQDFNLFLAGVSAGIMIMLGFYVYARED